MPDVMNTVAAALARAVTNDRYGPGGVVSVNDERNIVATGLAAISGSNEPMKVFEYNRRFVTAAEALLGSARNKGKALGSYERRGMAAVNARLAALSRDQELPAAARKAFADDAWHPLADIQFTNERMRTDGSFSFDYAYDGRNGSAFAVEFDGVWIISPVDFDPAILPDVLDAAYAHFDSFVVPQLTEYDDLSAAEIAELRAEIRITGLSEVENPWDEDKTDEGWEGGFPFEFGIDGGTGWADGGLYVGYKPDTGELNGFGRWA